MFTTINDVRDTFIDSLNLDGIEELEYERAEEWIRIARFNSGIRYEDITSEDIDAWVNEYNAGG